MSKESGQNPAPVVSGSAVLSAGLASALAAAVTSRFGVAGTLLGAALTTMIITGGAAILKAYLESVTGSVRRMPGKLRAGANRRRAGRSEAPVEYESPALRQGFMGKMGSALGWFSQLPVGNRRSILLKGLAGAAVAFLIGMGAVTAVEKGILKNSFSCGLWSECTAGQKPGIGGGGEQASSLSTIDNIVRGTGSPSQNVNQDQQVQDRSPDYGQPNTPQAPSDSGVDVNPFPQEPVGSDSGTGTPDSGAPDAGTPTPDTPAPVQPVPGGQNPSEPQPQSQDSASPVE